MIVYHGSNKRFSKLVISSKLVRSEASSLNEGLGIYFSTDKSVADSYGKFIYTIEIPNDIVLDFTNEHTCRKFLHGAIQLIQKRCNIDLRKYVKFSTIADCVWYGNVAVSGIANEIELCLDANERWYMETSETMRNKVYSALREYNKAVAKIYTFNYNIKGIGIIRRRGIPYATIRCRETCLAPNIYSPC